MTEQYMPTTEEVRDSYRYSNQRPDICGKDFGIEFDRWLAEHDRQTAEKAWERGVTTALNYAKRQPDGITLKLETFDGGEWQNPYSEAVQS